MKNNPLEPDMRKEYQSKEEIEEHLLQKLESLFDRPYILPMSEEEVKSSMHSHLTSIQQAFKIGFEKDYSNTFLITNPKALLKIFNKDTFLKLDEASQLLLLDRLDDILQKCSHNAHILTDHMTSQMVARQNQKEIKALTQDSKNKEENKKENEQEVERKQVEQDLLLLVIKFSLKLAGKKQETANKLVELVRRLTQGRRFQKCHVEYIYQYIKTKSQKTSAVEAQSRSTNIIDIGVRLLLQMFEQRFDIGPTNYFYFSGFLSGIQGFAAAMWFQVGEQIMQNEKNLPVLFNCFSQGIGGFECYFKQRELYYRILAKDYSPPSIHTYFSKHNIAIDSNGVRVGEFLPKKWYFLGIAHEKSFIYRHQFILVINDKQVLPTPIIDYYKVEKEAKFTSMTICKNFVGLLSSFILFKDYINNIKKFIQMYKQYEYGIFSNEQLRKINTEIFDNKLTDKLLLFFTPDRTNNKNNGEMLTNTGVLSQGSKSKLFHSGSINSVFPILEIIHKLSTDNPNQQLNLDSLINEFLKLINAIISTKSYALYEIENCNFFNLLFFHLTNLPKYAVNSNTIQILAEIRFQIGDSKLQEQFFQNLLFSSDFWINTDNIDVINEYWSFVKAIYSTSPVQYNKIFSIQNLIDLMVKISEIKDGHCCEYHKNTFLMFYQGQNIQQESIKERANSSSILATNELKPVPMRYKTSSLQEQSLFNIHKIYNIEKYLFPIAGVLEGVLTSGGDEIVDQIQYIAKALTVKSSPCFHMQMLKLLKVLLLDSKEERHCAKPSDFAAHFLNAKGLNILLYLCSNSSFDVKSMCVKLIDVLTSHTNLIKVRIDTDLITYLCNIILPKQMLESTSLLRKSKKGLIDTDLQSLSANAYQMVDEDEEETNQGQIDLQKGNSRNIEQFQAISGQYTKQIEEFAEGEKHTSQELRLALIEQPIQVKSPALFPGEDQENEEKQDCDEIAEIIQPKGRKGFNNKGLSLKTTTTEEESKQISKPSKLLGLKKLSISKSDEQQSDEESETFGEQKKFMNTQSIWLSESEQQEPKFGFGKGLALDIPEDSDTSMKRSKLKQHGKQIMFQEIDDQNKDDQYDDPVTGEKVSFANENTMSKSNLRNPKSFSFGFSDDDDDSGEEKDQFQEVEDIEVKLQNVQPSEKKPIILMQKPGFGTKSSVNRPQLSIQENDEELKQEEEVKVDMIKKRKNMLQGGTTGATSETNFESSYSSDKNQQKAVIQREEQSKTFTNANLKLNIDTEAINELFSYGGEKGQLLMTEQQEKDAFEQELDELASICLAAMQRENYYDPIEYQVPDQNQTRVKSSFETKYLIEQTSGEGNIPDTKQKNPRAQFMTPQSVRGIKKIQFQLNEKSKKGDSFNTQTILEENSPLGDSKSSSSRQEYIFGVGTDNLSLTHSDIFACKDNPLEGTPENDPLTRGKDVKSQTMTLSQIKKGGSLNLTSSSVKSSQQQKQTTDIIHKFGQLMKEEETLLEKTSTNDEYTSELENLYTSCLEWIINRAPSALYHDLKRNQLQIIDEVDKIQFTPALSLLMTLVTYSNNFVRQKALQDLHMLASTSWDSHNSTVILFHPTFHTWLLDLLMPYQDLTASYSNLQSSSQAVYDIGCKLHTLLLKTACLNPEEEAYKKINFLARWPAVVQQQVKGGLKGRTEKDIDTAHKLARQLLTSLLRSIKEETGRSRPQISQNYPAWKNLLYIATLVEELILSSHQRETLYDSIDQQRDINSSLLSWLQKDFLMMLSGTSDKQLWADWDLMEALFQTLDPLYPETFFKRAKDKGTVYQTIEENVYMFLQNSPPDEFNTDIELLMHEAKSHGQSIQQQQQQTTKETKSRGLFSQSQNFNSPLSLATQAMNTPQTNTATQNENTFMKTILNMLCVTLSQADTKQLVSQWLDRFERFVKFLMIVSETWKSKNVTYYKVVRDRFVDAITFAFSFLFHEIHASNRNMATTPPHQTQQQMPFSTSISTQSPKESMVGKLFAQSLKNLIIYFINIEFYKNKQTASHNDVVTACSKIFHDVLKSYSQGNVEKLMTFKDISRFKTQDYDDFPECFYMDDWKVTFFYSDIIKKIVKKQLNLGSLEQHLQKRKSYANHSIEMNLRTEKAKDEIMKRMQSDILEVISSLTEIEFERRNKVALLNENFLREQNYYWKKAFQILQGQRGIWKNHGQKKFYKSCMHKTNDGVRSIMKDRNNNGFEYLKNDPVLEAKIFKLVVPQTEEESKSLRAYENELPKESQNEIIPNKKFEESEEDEEDEEEEESKEDEWDQTKKIVHSKEKNPEQTSIVHFFSKTLTTRDKLSLKNSFITHLKDYIFTQRPRNKDLIELKCSILKPLYQRQGIILLTSRDIIFFDELHNGNSNQENDNIFFFKYQKSMSDLFYKIIPLQNLKEIQRRRFLGLKTGLELFLKDNSTLLLNFQNTVDRDQFAKKVVRQRNQKQMNLNYHDTLEPKKILRKRELTEKWMQWKISNFDYLMQLNILSGRSFNDLSQYPILPWILVDYASAYAPDITASYGGHGSAAPPGYRDLNKNMQLLGSAERQAEFKRKYEDSDNFLTMNDKFHCGSHYSNPGIVLHYLCRLSPYIDATVELHGKSLDKPDRCFHSLQESLYSALNDHSDVRELIPEFYFCPEMFLNLNKINFGEKQDGVTVNHVVLPQWCKGDPNLFVIFMKEAMESPYVSQNLNGWIDYIFGAKQRGTEAEKSLNVFSSLTYEDGVNLNNLEDEMLKKSYQLQIYNYGQTPSQLFAQKHMHPGKLPRSQVLKHHLVVDTISKIKVYKPVVQHAQNKQSSAQITHSRSLICNDAILKAKYQDDQIIIGVSKDGTVTYFIWLSRSHELNPQTPFTCCEDKKKKYYCKTMFNGIEMYDTSIKKFDFTMLILKEAKCILRGGFWDGKIVVCPIDSAVPSSDQLKELHVHQTTVTCIVCTSEENIIITGTKSGDVAVWNYMPSLNNESTFTIRKHMSDHECQITNIFINEEMCMYATCSLDGSANLYNLWSDKLIRTFQHPQLAPIHSVILTHTPLQACCFYSREDHSWFSFTINGHLLDKQKEECSHIVSPQVVKDSNFMDKLIYGTEKGFIIFRNLPLLKPIKKQQVSNNSPVLSIIVSPDRRFLLVGCADGGLNVITEPHNLAGIQYKDSSNIVVPQNIITTQQLEKSQSAISTTPKQTQYRD